MQFGGQTTVYAKELFVHDSSEGKGAERVHDCVVYPVGVFVLAFEFESEVIGQVPAFVVTAKKIKRVGVPDFE